MLAILGARSCVIQRWNAGQHRTASFRVPTRLALLRLWLREIFAMIDTSWLLLETPLLTTRADGMQRETRHRLAPCRGAQGRARAAGSSPVLSSLTFAASRWRSRCQRWLVPSGLVFRAPFAIVTRFGSWRDHPAVPCRSWCTMALYPAVDCVTVVKAAAPFPSNRGNLNRATRCPGPRASNARGPVETPPLSGNRGDHTTSPLHCKYVSKYLVHDRA